MTVRLSLSVDDVTIDVEDDGPGISDARAIALAHGGELSLHDRLPHGLAVRIRLPVRQQPQAAAA